MICVLSVSFILLCFDPLNHHNNHNRSQSHIYPYLTPHEPTNHTNICVRRIHRGSCFIREATELHFGIHECDQQDTPGESAKVCKYRNYYSTLPHPITLSLPLSEMKQVVSELNKIVNTKSLKKLIV